MYDIDENLISSTHHVIADGTRTTLAAPLTPGDTSIVLTDATGWDHTGQNPSRRGVIIFEYRNSFGYKYPNYSRINPSNLWEDGGVDIATNTVTLSTPFPASAGNPDDPNGTWPAGTDLANRWSGGFKYSGFSNFVPPASDEWFFRRGFIGGIDRSGGNRQNNFSPGTALVRAFWLANFTNRVGGLNSSPDTGPTHRVYFAGVCVSRSEETQLTEQTDGSWTLDTFLPSDGLQTGDNISELNNDVGFITAGSVPVQSVNGQAGTVVLDTDDVAEGSNLYHTDARVTANATVVANMAASAANMAAIAGLSDVASSGDYADLINLPASFPPDAHTHSELYDAAGGVIILQASGTDTLEVLATNSSFNGLLVNGEASFNDAFSVDGMANFIQNVSVDGSTTINSTLDVADMATFSGQSTFDDVATFSIEADFQGTVRAPNGNEGISQTLVDSTGDEYIVSGGLITGFNQAVHPHKQIYANSCRAYCYTNNRWIYPNAVYGPNYFQWNANGGTTVEPTVVWNQIGTIIPAGTVLKRIVVKGRANNNTVTGLKMFIRIHDADFFDQGLAIDTLAEANAVTVLPVTNILEYTTGNTLDMRATEVSLGDFVMPRDTDLHIFFQPEGTITATRYYYLTYMIEMELP